ncbi:MAG: hypothetical protein N4A46_04660 [Schleiferiaceae bacterium]|nr:hypothetical protein [Schleiferiaceae bacterium]
MRSFLSILAFVFVVVNVQAQSFKRYYQKSEKTYLGIDYTAARFVGAEGFPTPSDLPKLMNAWNEFVKTEPSKYNVPETFMDGKIEIDLSHAQKANDKIDVYNVVQEDNHTIDKDKAAEVALGYNFDGMSGLAFLFVAECYNKKYLAGSYYLVMVDAETKEVIYNERYVTKPKGFGLKNFWARTLNLMLKEVNKDLKKRLK